MKRNLTILTAVAALAFSTAAFAGADCKGGQSQSGGNCNTTTTTTTNNDYNAPILNNSLNNNKVNLGGTQVNGNGNQVNTGTQVNGGIKTTNIQGQFQGQGQSQSIKNSGNSFNVNLNKATGGNATGGNASVGDVVTTVGGQANTQSMTYNEAGTNDKDVEIANIQAGATRDAAQSQPQKIEVKTPGVASVPNIYPTSPCMGSTSAGVSFMGGAFSGGSSWKDDDCSYRETARMFDQLGYKKDGLVVMCQSEYAKEAPSCKALKAEAAKQASLAEENAKLREQLAARDSARTEEKRKTDATIRSEAKTSIKQVAATSYVSNGTCGAPATTETAGWKFDMAKCEWVEVK